jgi:hypothetical protein
MVVSIDSDAYYFTPPAGWEENLPAVNEAILDQYACPPTGNDYASQMMGIAEQDQPLYVLPHMIIELPEAQQQQASDALIKIGALLEANDLCDRVGIRYVGQYARFLCPQSPIYQQLNDTMKASMEGFLNSPYRQEMKVAAKAWANCF